MDFTILRVDSTKLLLLRSSDGYVSEFQDTGSSLDYIIQGLQRVIDTVVFCLPLYNVESLEKLASFNYYSPDYIPLSEVIIS